MTATPSPIDLSSLTNSRRGSSRLPYTKLVATIGPASEGCLRELIELGMSVARINFSHGSSEEHRRRADIVRKAAREVGRPVAILADIQGPKLRMGRFVGGSLDLEVGRELTVRQGGEVAEDDELLFNFDGFLQAVAVGHRVLLADGAVEAEVIDRARQSFRIRVTRAGTVADRKGVNLPDSELAVALPTEKDIEDIRLSRQIGVDMIGVSFVGSADDVDAVRELAPDQQIVSKIERSVALERITEILAASDGIMVARERLPLIQKSLITEGLRAGKFVITATEMLESMIHSSRPTRAEVADVANAVLDGTDAVMLSAETAVGRYPREAVDVMARIALAVEGSERYQALPRIEFRGSEPTFSNAIALAAVDAAEALGIRKIIAFTETGNTVRLLSRYRPEAELIALTPNEHTLNQIAILAHVRPLLFARQRNLEEMLQDASLFLLDGGHVRAGEQVLFVAGVPPGVARTTNMMKLHRIGEQLKFS